MRPMVPVPESADNLSGARVRARAELRGPSVPLALPDPGVPSRVTLRCVGWRARSRARAELRGLPSGRSGVPALAPADESFALGPSGGLPPERRAPSGIRAARPLTSRSPSAVRLASKGRISSGIRALAPPTCRSPPASRAGGRRSPGVESAVARALRVKCGGHRRSASRGDALEARSVLTHRT